MEAQSNSPPGKLKSEPLFVQFANFQFTSKPLRYFFTILKCEGIKVPLKEFFVYYRTEDRDYVNGPKHLAKGDKEKILNDLKSDQDEFRNLLSQLVVKDKEDDGDKLHFFLDKGNLYCSEVPIQFTYHNKYPGKLDLATPSTENVEEVGWANFLLALMAVDLGKYLMQNPVKRIRVCRNSNCGRFFTRRGGKAVFCSDDCKEEYHYTRLRDTGYFKNKMKEGRSKGKYQ